MEENHNFVFLNMFFNLIFSNYFNLFRIQELYVS